MEYGIRELSNMAGVSARTLRYYDEIGLLKPLYVNHAGYRYYGENEVNLLQQILFYRERGFDLKRIQQLVYQDDFSIMHALEEHLLDLEERRNHIDSVIHTVKQTMLKMKGVCDMSDKDKFAALKEQAVQENEARYGAEIREKYGNETVDGSNRKLLKMTEEEWQHFNALEHEIRKQLEAGVRAGITPESGQAGHIVSLHKEWLCMTWKKYTPAAHRGIAGLYQNDERFQAYYDETVPGCAKLLSEAVQCWVNN